MMGPKDFQRMTDKLLQVRNHLPAGEGMNPQVQTICAMIESEIGSAVRLVETLSQLHRLGYEFGTHRLKGDSE